MTCTTTIISAFCLVVVTDEILSADAGTVLLGIGHINK